MNDLERQIPEDGVPLASGLTQIVPSEVESRLQLRFVELRRRVVAQRHSAWWNRVAPRIHPLRWATAAGCTAALGIIVMAWLGARSNAWAQVANQMQSKPWIHAKGQMLGAPAEYWVSPSQGVWAITWQVGDAKIVEYASRASKLKLRYRAADRSLTRLPMTSFDEDGLRQIETMFEGVFKGNPGADASTSYERLVKQRMSEVDVDGKRWLDFELTFRAVDNGNHERVTIYRVDPTTKLPQSRIDAREFSDVPKTRFEFDYPLSGPEDIYALGATRDAKLVDYVPAPDLAQILAAMQTGREQMDAYSGLIVSGLSGQHWSEAAMVWRVWRNGNRWRIEQSDLFDPSWRKNLGKDVPPHLGDDVDPQTWWNAAAKTLRFYPVLVSDGTKSYRYKVKTDQEDPKTREDWEPDYISTPTRNGGPTLQLLPEYVSRPPLGVPFEGRQVTLDLHPKTGPKSTILVETRDTKPGSSQGQRVWIDPLRGSLAIRHELEFGKDSQGNPQSQARVIEDVAQSPSGIWYPRVVRSLASSNQIGEEIGNRPSGVTRYYLDFKSPIPPDVFGTPALKSPDQPASSPEKLGSKAQVQYRARSTDNLSSLGRAMNAYHTQHKHFPAAIVLGPDGKTAHSWRVALLPYLGLNALFDRYNLAEPWDSVNNLKVLAEMPDVYRADKDSKDTNTAYFVMTGNATLFPVRRSLGFRDIRDGASNTLLIVDAKRGIPWTKPDDLAYDAEQPLPSLGAFDPDGFCVVFADTSSRFIKRDEISDATLRALITPAGGEKVKRPD